MKLEIEALRGRVYELDVDDHPGYHDAESVAIYKCTWISLLSDSPLGFKPTNTIHKFHVEIDSDYLLAARKYSAIYGRFIQCFRKGINGEMTTLYTNLQSDIRGNPVAFEILNALRTHNSEVIKYVLSFLSFGKRAPLLDDPSLASTALRGWYATEERINNVQVDTELCDGIKTIIRTVLLPNLGTEPYPVHGPGSVAMRGVTSKLEKDKDMRLDKALLCAISSGDFRSPAVSFDRFIPERAAVGGMVRRDSRLHMVYKDINTFRTICMEPSELQYAQQSQLRDYEKALSTSLFHRFVRLDDQTHNSLTAQLCSANQDLDTIDLSSASDSLSWKVVKASFPATMLRRLGATRSRRVKTPDGYVVVNKFAPMGSALCFPVQCVFYVGLVIASYMQYAGISITPENVTSFLTLIGEQSGSTRGYGAIRVYGDDIICDSRITTLIIDNLRSLGFVVNDSKSFFLGQAYRESCGGHYLNGEDVTYLTAKFKGFFARNGIGPSLAASLIEFSNRALEYGYGTVRRTVLTVLHLYRNGRNSRPRPFLYGEEGIHGRWVVPLSYKERMSPIADDGLPRPEAMVGLVSEYGSHRDFQRNEVRVVVVSVRQTTEPRDELYEYVAWQRNPSRTDLPIRRQELNPRQSEAIFKQIWYPA